MIKSFEAVAVIEMPTGCKFKYEILKSSKILFLDRVLPIATPANYGYIEGTLEEDGDAIDVFVLETLPLYPKSAARVYIYGGFECEDNGVRDTKLLATLKPCAHTPEMLEKEVSDYLAWYKKGFKVIKRLNYDETYKVYSEAVAKARRR